MIITGMGDGTWGHLADGEIFGRVGDRTEDYVTVPFSEAKVLYGDRTHASHAMLFARSDKVLWDLYNVRAAVMMQMRFDGLIGFPGGLVDPGEDPVTGVNRELHEEINMDLSRFRFTDDDHVISYFHEKKSLVLHFFGKEVTLEEFSEIEERVSQACEHGIETMGSIRPPLFTMGDNFRGLPAFLTNHFIGHAKEQLLYSLAKFDILTDAEIRKAVKAAKDFDKTQR